MLGAVGLMSLGIVLGKRWGSPGTALMSTAWQMTLGGLVLAPSTLGFEGLPEVLTLQNVAGFGYLATLGGAFAYILWFRGIERLTPTSASLLTLASPLTATLAGLIILGQTLTAFQVVGLAVALVAPAECRVATDWTERWTICPVDLLLRSIAGDRRGDFSAGAADRASRLRDRDSGGLAHGPEQLRHSRSGCVGGGNR
jgi:hypothetical protein